jgi:hypothetical protein
MSHYEQITRRLKRLEQQQGAASDKAAPQTDGLASLYQRILHEHALPGQDQQLLQQFLAWSSTQIGQRTEEQVGAEFRRMLSCFTDEGLRILRRALEQEKARETDA